MFLFKHLLISNLSTVYRNVAALSIMTLTPVPSSSLTNLLVLAYNHSSEDNSFSYQVHLLPNWSTRSSKDSHSLFKRFTHVERFRKNEG